MTHDSWSYTQRLIARLGDSSLNVVRLPAKQDRSPGLHASDLLKVLHPVESMITEEELKLYGILGFAFEDRVERAMISLSDETDFPWTVERSPEVSHEGIAMTPDLLLFPKDGTAEPVEMSIKVTWKSSTEAPDGIKFQYYNDQCMTYATSLDTLASVLLVYFVNGNYAHQRKGGRSKPAVPQIKAWDLSFTPRERSETWQALRQIAKDFR